MLLETEGILTKTCNPGQHLREEHVGTERDTPTPDLTTKQYTPNENDQQHQHSERASKHNKYVTQRSKNTNQAFCSIPIQGI